MIINLGIDRPTRAEIDLSAFVGNYKKIKNNFSVMAMVKANAYGHGITKISRVLTDLNVDFLGVAYIEEAVYLRKQGIDVPILVLGAINPNQLKDFIDWNIDITASSIEKLKAVDTIAKICGKKARVHLKFDTGMERIGVHWYNANSMISVLKDLTNIDIIGVFSHFSCSDTDEEFTNTQISRFDNVVQSLNSSGLYAKYYHLSNSSGVKFEVPKYINMIRPGISLYGYGISNLKPVMNFKTSVSYFKVVRKGNPISYNHTFTPNVDTRIITLPVGYGDGYMRALSNKSKVAIGDKLYPVVGNICMDQMMVDIGPEGTAYNGDEVLLFGGNGKLEISAEELASLAGTISYELLCGISLRVPRVYLNKM
ncbi:MAG: alanine racemase [Candidatus Delongbacteria bacterium]|nr:alanine racemase [Candidatus Delongbacteria bacterium]MBN2833411.1 alanine racemase [Candidatus Delongbacteria bacterium]